MNCSAALLEVWVWSCLPLSNATELLIQHYSSASHPSKVTTMSRQPKTQTTVADFRWGLRTRKPGTIETRSSGLGDTPASGGST
eukprot:7064746-Karenia_brevis.AAC.1